MTGIAYDVTIGSQRASSSKRDSDRQLVALMTELDMDGVGGRCVVELVGAVETPPKLADKVTVSLDNGDGKKTVFSGEVEAVEATTTGQRISAQDGVVKLARLDVEQSYENVSLDYISRDLLQQAKLTVGTLAKGPPVSSCVLFHGPRALAHIRRLAALYGVDLYTDGDGKVYLAGPETQGTDHAFVYGEDVLELALQAVPVVHDGVEVWGEGAASRKGADKYYWLPTDTSSVSGKAALGTDGVVSKGGSGKHPSRLISGLVRSGDAAGRCAEGIMKALSERRVQGHIMVFGAPAVMPADRVKLSKLPAAHAAAAAMPAAGLRVRQVQHSLDMQRGFVTWLGF